MGVKKLVCVVVLCSASLSGLPVSGRGADVMALILIQQSHGGHVLAVRALLNLPVSVWSKNANIGRMSVNPGLSRHPAFPTFSTLSALLPASISSNLH